MKISKPSHKNIKSLMLKANKLTAKSSRVSTARKFEVPKKNGGDYPRRMEVA